MSLEQDQAHVVRKTIVVEANRERAFEVFTNGLDRWWPRSHKIGPANLARAVLEPRAGGRWYEIDDDGSECDWGKVLEWDPPSRLVLTWQISAQWAFDPEFVTEVEVRFIAEAERRTRVELEHRHLERYGDQRNTMRDTFESPAGWGGILDGYRQAVEG